MPRDARCCSARCEVSVRVGWAAVGFGAGDLAVLLYVPIALPLVGAQTLGVAGSEGRATRQHRAAGGLWTRAKAMRRARTWRAGSEGEANAPDRVSRKNGEASQAESGCIFTASAGGT